MNQCNAELQSIKDTINLYIQGLQTGNIDTLRKAFHAKAMMYGTSNNNITVVEIDGLYQFVSANFPPPSSDDPYQCFITNISYSGNAASVEMVEESAYGSDYTDYFHLLKIEGKWLILSKTYNARPH